MIDCYLFFSVHFDELKVNLNLIRWQRLHAYSPRYTSSVSFAPISSPHFIPFDLITRNKRIMSNFPKLIFIASSVSKLEP